MDKNQLQVKQQLKFVLNAQVPDVENCWQEGYEMCQSYCDENNNPYKENTRAHHYWSEGWWAAYYGEEPTYNLTESCAHETSVSVKVFNREAILASKEERYATYAFELGCVLFLAILGFELAGLAG